MKDNKTIEYFDTNTPEYNVDKLGHAFNFIKKYVKEDSSLIDVGCGTGNILEYVYHNLGIRTLCAVDVSSNYLNKTTQRVKCVTHLGSIADAKFISGIASRFNFVILSAVLHHLIGATRKESKKLAMTAIQNALSLLDKQGILIIHEPTFYPPFSMDCVFYIKKYISMLTSRRIGVFGKWNNIGAPVVSYYNNEELLEMVPQSNYTNIIDKHIDEDNVGLLFRLAFISKRANTTIIIQKSE
jgi:SAM-dependent methyltransferase